MTGCCPILLVSLCILVVFFCWYFSSPSCRTGDLWVLLHSVYCGLLTDYLLFIYCTVNGTNQRITIYCLFLVLLLAACFSAFFCQSEVCTFVRRNRAPATCMAVVCSKYLFARTLAHCLVLPVLSCIGTTRRLRCQNPLPSRLDDLQFFLQSFDEKHEQFLQAAAAVYFKVCLQKNLAEVTWQINNLYIYIIIDIINDIQPGILTMLNTRTDAVSRCAVPPEDAQKARKLTGKLTGTTGGTS